MFSLAFSTYLLQLLLANASQAGGQEARRTDQTFTPSFRSVLRHSRMTILRPVLELRYDIVDMPIICFGQPAAGGVFQPLQSRRVVRLSLSERRGATRDEDQAGVG
ncbi:hypothetical protein RRF57_002368 [Xylaria bambusicola]|uniref:Secreted protein n=1 Tax=Xylaria bambusicola TaxID=326684 RepID=A0AAN7UDH7_9PEZI